MTVLFFKFKTKKIIEVILIKQRLENLQIFSANGPLLYSQLLELFNEVRFEIWKVEYLQSIYFDHLNFIGNLAPVFILFM